MDMDKYTYGLETTHCGELLTLMNEQRKAKDENLCDVRFIVGSNCVYAHRSVLAACSAYFKGLWSGAFLESQGETGTRSRMMEIDFTGSVSKISHLDTLLSAIYTGSLVLSAENVIGVTELSCFLLVDRVSAMCETFLHENLSIHNCLHYLKVAFKYDLHNLLRTCRQLVQCRFHDYFIRQREMLRMALPCLMSLDKIYKYVRLEDVAQFLARWVESEVDSGEISSTREEKIAAARSIFGSQYQDLKSECPNEVLQTHSSVNVADVIGESAGQGFLWYQNSNTKSSATSCVVKESNKDEFFPVIKSVGAEISPRHCTSELENQVRNKCGKHCEETGCSNCQDTGDRCHSEDSACFTPRKSEAVSVEDKDQTASISDVSSGTSHDTDKLTCGSSSDACNSSSRNPDIDISSDNNADTARPSGSTSDKTDDSSEAQSLLGSSRTLKRIMSSIDTTIDDMKRQKLEVDDNGLCDVLVAFAPEDSTVNFFTATDCARNRPRFCRVELQVCLYHIKQKQWLWAGRAVFPERLEDRDSWRVACVNCKAYFLSLRRQAAYILDLKTMKWDKLDCQPLFVNMSSNFKVRSLVPVAVEGRLYVLVSDKQQQGETYLTLQRYFQLEANNTWQAVADVKHTHQCTPLTLLSVSDGKVFAAKADITSEKSMLVVRETHIFDPYKGEVSKSDGTTYGASPMRVLVRNGHIHIVDGESLHHQLRLGSNHWDLEGEVDLSDIKIARACADDCSLPCLTHTTCAMGSSVWEYSGFNRHSSTLTELHLTTDDQIYTERHPPPPFRYVSLMTATQLSADLVSALEPCQYLHADTHLNSS